MDCNPPGFSVHGDSPGKNIGVGCHALLQGIFPTQGSNPGLPHFRQILYHLSHQGSPRIMEWAASLFSRGYFPPGFKPGSPALQADSLLMHFIVCFQREWESWGKGEELIILYTSNYSNSFTKSMCLFYNKQSWKKQLEKKFFLHPGSKIQDKLLLVGKLKLKVRIN